MSFFSDEEIDSLKITRMILHVVGTKDFAAMPERALEEEPFFIGKIVDMATAPVFMFKAVSVTRNEVEAIASADTSFVAGAQALAASFNRAHVGGSADGVLLMFELSVADPDVKIYSLIKYDYKLALEQNDGAPGKKLRRIVNALVDEKKAIQKTALIRVINGVADQNISATDRTKQGVDLADYFADFLAVSRAVSDTELSEITRKVLKAALQTCIEHLPGQDKAKHSAGVLPRCVLTVDAGAVQEKVLYRTPITDMGAAREGVEFHAVVFVWEAFRIVLQELMDRCTELLNQRSNLHPNAVSHGAG
ncbi:hypothetical protein ABE521_00555 [Pseudomonas sp. TWI672]|uniref:hypothetical protein n=1 Tax=unclassified Pseudomonas TaxID=196821 RepID=UPI00320B63CC